MSEAPKTVWVTKYALTRGIEECTLVEFREMFSSRFAVVRWPGFETGGTVLANCDYRLCREAALTRANEMKAAKIASLKRQIEKLEALEF